MKNPFKYVENASNGDDTQQDSVSMSLPMHGVFEDGSEKHVTT